jgi:23S rRNA pseudouridine955/2504/2580 synthase
MDRTRSHTVPSRDADKRLDRVLRELMPDVSLGRLAKLIRKGRIRVNDAKTRHQQRVKSGDVITFREAPIEDAWTKKGRDRMFSGKVAAVQSVDFTILHEDAHMMAVSKPAGLLVHGSLREPDAITLIDQVLAYTAQTQIEQSDDEESDDRDLSEFVRPSPKFQPSLAHRIDRDTSGVVLIAKTLECLQELTRIIKKRKIGKFYVGLIKGGLKGGQGVIDAPVSRRDHAGKRAGRQQVDVGEKHDVAKTAVTKYRVLCGKGSYSLVEFELVTGRTHQIRAHMRHMGSAIIGDHDYGDRMINRHAKEAFGLDRQFLHAARVVLEHPLTHEALDIVAPLPPDLAEPLLKAGFTAEDLPEYLRRDFETSVRVVGVELTPGKGAPAAADGTDGDPPDADDGGDGE